MSIAKNGKFETFLVKCEHEVLFFLKEVIIMDGKRLKVLRLEKGMTQEEFASRVHVTQRAVSNWELSKREPPEAAIEEMCKLFDVSADYLLGFSNERKPAPKATKIPILGNIAAGVPISAITDIEGYEEITEAMSRCGEFFALRIKGESMMPWICPMDIVICKVQSDVDSGKVAIVLINGEDATCKKVIKSRTGITLYGFNMSVYEPHFYTNREIRELPIIVIGEVVEVRRTMNLWSAKG